ncbi:hypothetical protein [Maliponia aquimaris]|uniref:Uncharacterized protein n=1 Tax=Maliponia aquimaris TaxID=1673631 RepID=A0A238K811_9RHOB|nr:hypothetical protein [Maliponia aquimaris]SMX38086.1 hypothetical protein MAA8898_01368 [Maliponia aquimaris]
MQSNAFRALVLTVLAFCAPATAALANWEFEGGPEAEVHTARVCEGRDQVLCFELGCTTGEPLGFRLTSRNMAEMVAAPRLDTLLFVGSQLAGSLEFSQSGLESFRAPLEETHLRGIDRLRAGIRAQLHVWYSAEGAPEIHQFTLIGSNAAISAVQEQCPLPDFAERELERRTLADPAAKVLSDMREACSVLSGTLTEGAGFAVPFDLDGQEPMDLRVNHGALVCDSTPDLVCGTAGCLTSLWQGLDDGRYRRVFLNAVQDAETVEPGVVKMSFKGSRCKGVEAEEGQEPVCDALYDLSDFELTPRP